MFNWGQNCLGGEELPPPPPPLQQPSPVAFGRIASFKNPSVANCLRHNFSCLPPPNASPSLSLATSYDLGAGSASATSMQPSRYCTALPLPMTCFAVPLRKRLPLMVLCRLPPAEPPQSTSMSLGPHFRCVAHCGQHISCNKTPAPSTACSTPSHCETSTLHVTPPVLSNAAVVELAVATRTSQARAAADRQEGTRAAARA